MKAHDTKRLLEKVAHTGALRAALARVARKGGMPGSDGVRLEDFCSDAEAQLAGLRSELLSGTWRPGPGLRVQRASEPNRPLVVPNVRDRVVQRAIADMLAPLLEPEMQESSHAFRRGRSAHTAAAAVDAAIASGLHHVARGDVEKFFDRIDRGRLLAALGKHVQDTRLLEIVRLLLASGVFDGERLFDPETGIAQGSPLSPLLSNVYLSPFDRALGALSDTVLVRYCDDFVLLAAHERAALAALDVAGRALDALGLRLHPDKTHVGTAERGFVFVGLAFTSAGHGPPAPVLDALAVRLRVLPAEARDGARRGFEAFYGPIGPYRGPLIERLTLDGGLEAADWLARAPSTAPSAAPARLWDGADEVARVEDERQARRDAERFSLTLTDEAIAFFLRCFAGREGCHAKEVMGADGHRRYIHVLGDLDADRIRRHVGGRSSLGAYVFRADETVRWLCLDVDATRSALDAPAADVQDLVHLAHLDAWALASALEKLGAPALIEDSGYKGRHVWVRFDAPVRADLALALAFAAEDAVGPPPEGVRRERFPDRTRLRPGIDGPLVKLPWGLHGRTHRRCLFVGEEGSPLPDQVRTLVSWQPTPRGALAAFLAPPSEPRPAGAADGGRTERPSLEELSLTARVLRGCALLAHVVEKARATRYLDHAERLLVLMTFGHLGGEAADAVHAVMRLTYNYKPAETDRWLKRPAPSPISCPRIRERYPQLTRLVPCDCHLRLTRGAYPSPILHALTASEVPGFTESRRQEAVRKRSGEVRSAPAATSDSRPATKAESVPGPVACDPESGPKQVDAHEVDQALAAYAEARRALDCARAHLEALFASNGGASLSTRIGALRRLAGEDGSVRYSVDVGESP